MVNIVSAYLILIDRCQRNTLSSALQSEIRLTTPCQNEFDVLVVRRICTRNGVYRVWFKSAWVCALKSFDCQFLSYHKVKSRRTKGKTCFSLFTHHTLFYFIVFTAFSFVCFSSKCASSMRHSMSYKTQ